MRSVALVFLVGLALGCGHGSPVGPDGAGTIAPSTDMVVPDMADHGGHALVAALAPAEGVPAGPGGRLTLSGNAGQSELCYALRVSGIAPATAAHLHRGSAGAAGPEVWLLLTPNAAGYVRECAEAPTRGLSGPLIRELTKAPGQFYVDVHNAAYPSGVLHGQLERHKQPYR